MEPPTYWMWVVNNFKADLEEATGGAVEERAIPDLWENVTREEAVFSLFNMYDLNMYRAHYYGNINHDYNKLDDNYIIDEDDFDDFDDS